MYKFRVNVHRRAADAGEEKRLTVGDRGIATLELKTRPENFHVTFDRASEILIALPRMFLEPDGSFVWTGEQEGQPWQVDGVLYDAGPTLAHVEMSGACPANEFDQFLAALGWPAAPVMFQLIQEGVFVSEEEFRRLASENT